MTGGLKYRHYQQGRDCLRLLPVCDPLPVELEMILNTRSCPLVSKINLVEPVQELDDRYAKEYRNNHKDRSRRATCIRLA